MNCQKCRGACCEEFNLGILEFRAMNQDHRRWLELHSELGITSMTFECRCKVLNKDGLCGIYPNRPKICSNYPAGGPDCLAVVKRRRTPIDYELIREDGDPECL